MRLKLYCSQPAALPMSEHPGCTAWTDSCVELGWHHGPNDMTRQALTLCGLPAYSASNEAQHVTSQALQRISWHISLRRPHSRQI